MLDKIYWQNSFFHVFTKQLSPGPIWQNMTEYGKLKSSWVIHFFLSEYLMSNKAYSLKKILICRHMTLGSGGGSVCQILFY